MAVLWQTRVGWRPPRVPAPPVPGRAARALPGALHSAPTTSPTARAATTAATAAKPAVSNLASPTPWGPAREKDQKLRRPRETGARGFLVVEERCRLRKAARVADPDGQGCRADLIWTT